MFRILIRRDPNRMRRAEDGGYIAAMQAARRAVLHGLISAAASAQRRSKDSHR
jgi:hypothetical protein